MARRIPFHQSRLASPALTPTKTKSVTSDSLHSNFPLYDSFFEHDACGVAFIADIRGRKSHYIISQSLTALENLKHRGASGAEKNSGDGAGIIMQIPHAFLRNETKPLGINLPNPGSYAVGVLFLPKNKQNRKACEAIVEKIIIESGMKILGFRDVPVNNEPLGQTAKDAQPFIRHVFIEKGKSIKNLKSFERALYLVRRLIEKNIAKSEIPQKESFYIPSFSAKTIVYKGMLIAEQIGIFYPDLKNSKIKSAFAIVHQRFSTNTFPSWKLAHPFRYIAHNGEINTLRGNKNWIHTREQHFTSPVYGNKLKQLFPVIQDGSDSSALDNVLELLIATGMSLPQALMILIPEPWEKHQHMNPQKKAFYNFYSSMMEPWDGPALIVCTDGEYIGATLDRNGLRPARYYVTKQNKVIMASEAGVIPVKPEDVLQKGRLRPGRMLLVNIKQKRIIDDDEIKESIASQKPYREWIKKYRLHIDDLPEPKKKVKQVKQLLKKQQLFGYSLEEKRVVLAPMAKTAKEAMGSMGNDTPISVLSENSQLLFTYFKQLFAQVTNPPLDALREELVTAMTVYLGIDGNLINPSPKSCRLIEVPTPILSDYQLEKIMSYRKAGFKTAVLPMFFPVKNGEKGLVTALENLYKKADLAIKKGYTILVLSDKGATKDMAPIPSLLAVAGLHHHLIREGIREKIRIIASCGDAREVHHFCTLVGYGASAVHPYLAYATIEQMVDEGTLRIEKKEAIKNYRKSSHYGFLKVMSKMGISTIDAYRGAQIFEAVGLNQELIDRYFTNTPSKISGIGIEQVAKEVLIRHERAFGKKTINKQQLPLGGEYQWRRSGRRHLYSPEIIAKLQHATRTDQYTVFKEYSTLVNNLSKETGTLRGLLELKTRKQPIPLADVEPVEAIIKRFTTGAMSFGSLSQEAHETIAIAMNRLGAKSNSGEGGEDPARFVKDANGDWRRSAIKQVASGRFGVTSEYLVNAQELQIKMAQGAKPGEGGQLPGEKVYPWIAKVRHTTAGVGLISPPPHHDIYSIEDLYQLIYDLRNANPEARISVKLAAEVGVGTVAAGVAKAHAQAVVVSGHEGGTGAAPLTSIKHTGIPWEIGLAETQQVLMKNGLRSKIVVQTDGHLKTGRDVIVAALLGAEEFGFATAPLTVLGCVMMRVCHLDTCPVGIATQNPELRKRFAGQPEHLISFFTFVAQEVRELMSELGFRTMDEMIGRVDKLNFNPALSHWKAKGLDLSVLLDAKPNGKTPTRCTVKRTYKLAKVLDRQLIRVAKKALKQKENVSGTFRIKNTNRTVGTMLGYEITKRHGAKGLKPDTISFTFQGSAGQSFGAFIPRGFTMTLIGDANDHVGKGLSGGKIIVSAPAASPFLPQENIIIGNVALYGATSGEAYINGIAGERFAVRNSGAVAVVEGVGDHGCEYMTGGTVVILGEVGRNFGAGMSGGVAYILDKEKQLVEQYNKDMVDLEPLNEDDKKQLLHLISRHGSFTGSPLADRILRKWEKYEPLFVKVISKEYKRILEQNLSGTGNQTEDISNSKSQIAKLQLKS